jgi:hypothetical protein
MVKEAEIMQNLLKGLWSNRFQWKSWLSVGLDSEGKIQFIN